MSQYKYLNSVNSDIDNARNRYETEYETGNIQ